MRFLFCFVASVAWLPGMTVALADGRACDAGHGCDQGCCSVQCPNCDHVCKLSVSKEKDDKDCFLIECEPICIPKVVFPWQKRQHCNDCCSKGCDHAAGCCTGCKPVKCSCANNGARVRNVKVLKKHDYKCDKCKYEWKAVPVCGGCHHGRCDVGEAAAPASDAPSIPAPPANTSASVDRVKGAGSVRRNYSR